MRIRVCSETHSLYAFSASAFADIWTSEDWSVSPSDKVVTLPTASNVHSPEETRRREDLRQFWTSVYRPGVSAEAPNLAPFKVVTPFTRGTIQQMSFIFACLCGLGSLLRPNSGMTRFEYQPGNARLNVNSFFQCDLQLLNRLSAWHFIHMYDEGHIEPTTNPCMRLLCLNGRDRMQYLREMTSSRSVPWLEEARWFTVDAASEPQCYSEGQTLVSLISDMSLLLALLEMGALSDAEDMKHLVVLLVLTYFGESYVASSSPNLDALRYCLVVHALSVIRCIALDSFHKRSARRHDLDILRLQRHVVLCRTHAVCGFCVYMNMMGFDASVSGPLSSAFELGKDMSVAMQDTGLWPLFLNPMMLAGERWSDVKDRTPFKGYDLHPSIANTRFPSRMRLLSFDVEDAADRAAVVASELVSMRQPDRDQKGTRHAVKSSRPLTFSKLTLDELHPQDLFLGLHRTISTQNLIHQPDSWLAAIPDPDETSRLRCSMAVAVSRGVAGCLNILRKAQDQMWHDTAKHAEAFCFCPLSLQRPQEKRPILNLVLPYVGGHVPSSDVIRPLLDVFSASLRIPPESTMTQEENNPCQVHGNAEALARIRKLYQSRKQRVSESNGASENCRNDNSTKSENPKKERARLSKKEDGRRSKNKKQPRSVKPKNSQPWTLTVIHEEQNLDEPVKVQELEIVESSTAGRRTKIDRARATNRPVLLTSVLARASTSRSLTIGCVEARRLGSYTC